MKLKKLLHRQCKEIISIGFGEQGLKAAVTVRDDDIYAVKVFRRSWPETLRQNGYLENAEETAAVIKNMLAEQHISDLKNAVFVIPDDGIIIKQLSFPKMSDKEVIEAFCWEREQYIPYAEASCCQSLQIRQRAEESCLMVKALPKAAADYFTAVSAAAGLELMALTSENMAAGAFIQQQDFAVVKPLGDKFALQIYTDNLPAESAVVDDGNIAGSIHDYCRRCGKNIRSVICIDTEKSCEKDLAEQDFTVQHAVFEQIKWDGSFMNEAEQQATAADFCYEIGSGAAVLRGEDISLLTAGSRGVSKALAFKAASAFSAAMIILMWSGAYIFSCWQDLELTRGEYKLNALSVWQQRYEQYTAQKNKLDELTAALEKINGDKVQWCRLLEIFGSDIPKGCWINSVRETAGDKKLIEIEGKAVDIKSVDTFIGRLQQHQELAAVELTGTKNSKDKQQDYVAYSIALHLKGEKHE